jgi:DegV family protein with EDD domain
MFAIITDSSVDLTPEQLKEYAIRVAPQYVDLGEGHMKDDDSMSPSEFYEKIINEKIFPKTSFPSQSDFREIFIEYLSKGTDILCYVISRKISGSYNAAHGLIEELSEKYGRKIVVLDCPVTTAAHGYACIEASRMRAAGYSIEYTASALEKLGKRSKVNVTVDSLEFLRRGGRIGGAAALVGVIMNIKPLIFMKDGELHPGGKVRGRKKAIDEIISATLKDIGDKPEDFNVVVLQSTSLDDALYAVKKLKESGVPDVIGPCEIGKLVGSHLGPTAVAIGYFPKYETI